MQGKHMIGLVSAVVLIFMALGAVSAAPPVPEGVITLQVPEGEKATRPRVDFRHEVHADLDCAKCHHMWDGSSDVIQPCNDAGCHDDYKDKRGPNSYYQAFHSPARDLEHASCMSCHRELLKAGETAGPTSCAKGSSCHVDE